MKINVSVRDDGGNHLREVDWPVGWPVPRVGEHVATSGGMTRVRSVVYKPDHGYAFVSLAPMERV